jgi:ABC-type Na+ transport system ATPase subunit NatA
MAAPGSPASWPSLREYHRPVAGNTAVTNTGVTNIADADTARAAELAPPRRRPAPRGLAAPTSGRALVGGRRYDGLIQPLREVGSLLDATALHADRTAWAHLWSIAQANGITKERVTEVLGLTGLESVARCRVGGFSLGMKQRLGIAAALLGDPPVLMFDEPVNGLDPEGIGWIRWFFRELAADGRTVLVSSHLMSEMAQTADHLVVIGRGRLLADVPLGAIIRHTAGGIAATIAVILVPGIAALLPAPWDGRIGRFTLLEAAQQVSALHPAADLFFPGWSLLVLLAWPAASLAAAAILITRRDA